MICGQAKQKHNLLKFQKTEPNSNNNIWKNDETNRGRKAYSENRLFCTSSVFEPQACVYVYFTSMTDTQLLEKRIWLKKKRFRDIKMMMIKQKKSRNVEMFFDSPFSAKAGQNVLCSETSSSADSSASARTYGLQWSACFTWTLVDHPQNWKWNWTIAVNSMLTDPDRSHTMDIPNCITDLQHVISVMQVK